MAKATKDENQRGSRGKVFEEKIKEDAKRYKNVFVEKIPDISRFIPGRGIQRQNGPFDFAGAVNGKAIFFDAKVTTHNDFNLKSYIFKEKKVIKDGKEITKIDDHQFKRLSRAALAGNIAGFLVHFKKHNKICFIKTSVILSCKMKDEKGIGPDHHGLMVQDADRLIDFEHIFGFKNQEEVKSVIDVSEIKLDSKAKSFKDVAKLFSSLKKK